MHVNVYVFKLVRVHVHVLVFVLVRMHVFVLASCTCQGGLSMC